MNKGIAVSLALSLFLSSGVHSKTITMQEFLGRVSTTHPFFVKESISSLIEKKVEERFLGQQDWLLSSSPGYNYQEPLETGPFVPKAVHSLGFDVATERAIWKTGGRLSLSWSSILTDQETSDIVIPGIITIPSGPSRFYQHGIFSTYSHPLWKNKNGRLDRLGYELVGYSVRSTELEAYENQEEFLLELGLGFLDWVLLAEQVGIAKERLVLAQKQLDQSKRKRAANLIDKVDVLRAEDAVRIAEQNVMLLESRWKAKQAELATIAQSEEIYSMSPDYDLYAVKELMPVEDEVSRLKRDSRSLNVLAIIEKQLHHQRAGLSNVTHPQLDLNLRAGVLEGKEVFGKSLGLQKPDFFVGVLFSYPLGNRTAKADVEKVDLQIRQLEEEVRNVELGLESVGRNLWIQIKEMEKVLALNREQIESARRKTQEEIRLYNQGRSQLTFVIQSRDNEESSKLIYAQNAALYHKLMLQYSALMDELLPTVSTTRN